MKIDMGDCIFWIAMLVILGAPVTVILIAHESDNSYNVYQITEDGEKILLHKNVKHAYTSRGSSRFEVNGAQHTITGPHIIEEVTNED